MVSFVDNAEQRWSEIESELNRHKEQLSTLRYTYDEWLRLYDLCVRTHGPELHSKIDDAFQRLNDLTLTLLSSSDEEINAHEDNSSKSEVLSAIKTARDAFHCLSQKFEKGVQKTSTFNQEVFVREYGSVRYGEELCSFEGTLQSERLQAEATRCGYEKEAQAAADELRSIDNRLREYDDMNVVEQLFNSNPHNGWDGRRRDQANTYNDWQNKFNRVNTFESRIQGACRDIGNLSRDNQNLFARNVNDEHSIIDAKVIAFGVYEKLRDMENYIINTEVKVGIEDALRHVLKLMYVSVTVVDEDVHVKDFKRLILGSICDKYGREKTEELKQERKYVDPLELM